MTDEKETKKVRLAKIGDMRQKMIVRKRSELNDDGDLVHHRDYVGILDTGSPIIPKKGGATKAMTFDHMGITFMPINHVNDPVTGEMRDVGLRDRVKTATGDILTWDENDVIPNATEEADVPIDLLSKLKAWIDGGWLVIEGETPITPRDAHAAQFGPKRPGSATATPRQGGRTATEGQTTPPAPPTRPTGPKPQG